jgi:formylmethanofuran dehydrogenase subunit C
MAGNSQGENVMSTSTWTGDVNSEWAEAGNWSPAGVPDASSDVVIAAGAPIASASIGTVNSIDDSSELFFESAGTSTVATFLDNTGSLQVDDGAGEGGTTLDIGGALTNGGSLRIGNATLSAPDTVSAASLDNTGKIYLTGAGDDQALLDVAGGAGFGAAGVLSGYVRLERDSAIEFASGEITSLAKGAHLGLNGSDAFIEDSAALGSNCVLTGLASIGPGATLTLHNGPAVSTAGSLDNEGHLYLDSVDGNGGSGLTVGGTLTNDLNLVIGNAALSASDDVTAAALDNPGGIILVGAGANQALLDVITGSAGFGAAGVLSGEVQLSGDSAIEFASGQITSVPASADLSLDGSDAFIEDSTALGSNSALRGLDNVAGAFSLYDGASASTTGALAISGNGNLDVDYGEGGGSSLTVAGALTNSNILAIGNTYLSSSSKVSTTALTNTGSIDLTGSTGPNQALLDVTGAAGFGTAGVLSGDVQLVGDSAIEFASGQISTIATGASLALSGNDAFIEDSSLLGSNSALTGLADVAGALTLHDGASASTTGALVNNGFIVLYDGNLGVAGTLTNDGAVDITGGAEELAGAVDGTGSFNVRGARLRFDSSVSSGQTIKETGADRLTLEQGQSFAATIRGFGTGDTIDATSFVETGTTYNFIENSAGTGGTLTLTDTSQDLTANIHLTGHYSNSSFTLAPDSGIGTLVKFV